MHQLTAAGLLTSPHTSAGRAPTHAGLRLFVDGLMEVGDLGLEEQREIDARLGGMGAGANVGEALEAASAILSGLAGGAGIVATPVSDAGVRHVEFVKLGLDQALAVLVADDGTVENRIMNLSAGVTPSTLQEASNFLSQRLRGRPLADARQEMRAEVDVARRELDEAGARLVEQGLAAWTGQGDRDRSLIVRGHSKLLQDARAAEDIERVRVLFDDLEQKEQLIGLLDDVGVAQGVRIYIGAETRLFSLSGSAVIAAPYMSGRQRVLGAIGVIGPARLNYARVIPLVDYTARVLGRILDGQEK